MTAKIQDLYIDQGADYDIPFFLLDDSGYPENLVGATAVMQVRWTYDDPAVLTLTTANGSLVIDGPGGLITPHISDVTTLELLPGDYVYDIRMLDSLGRVSRPRQGRFIVIPAVTKIPPPPPTPAPSPDVYGTADGDVYGDADGNMYGPIPSPSPSPSPDVYGNAGGEIYGDSNGNMYGPSASSPPSSGLNFSDGDNFTYTGLIL